MGKTPQTDMEGVKETVEDFDIIIFDILFGGQSSKPPMEDAEVMSIDGDCKKSEAKLPSCPAREDLMQNLLRQMESLQREWMTQSLAEVTENSSNCSWTWKWILGGIAVIIGGAVYPWYYRWRGRNSGGAGNGGGGAGEEGYGAVVLLGQEDLAAPDPAAYPPRGPVGIQILLSTSDPSSGPLVCHRIASVDDLLPTTCGTRAAAAHLVPSALPAATTIIAEALREVIIAATIEEFSSLKLSPKEALNVLEIAQNVKMFTGEDCCNVTDDMKSEVVSGLKVVFQELISNLSKDKGNTIMDEDAPKLKSEHTMAMMAGPVQTTLCDKDAPKLCKSEHTMVMMAGPVQTTLCV